VNESKAIRLQKLLSQAGIASRRASEQLIADGRVMVDGKTVTEMGIKVDPTRSDIKVDGRRVKSAERHRYILLYKPAGVVTTRSDPQRRRTVIDLLGGVREYVYPVGRLDYDTEGLLLLTNDGDLAAMLTHPRHGVERTYEARVAGVPAEEGLERLRTGIPLDGHRTLPAEAVLLNRRARAKPGRPEGLVKITIREGRNRQVRRMLEAIGHPVRDLTRTRIGPITDRYLKPGYWRELTEAEVRTLKNLSQKPSQRPSQRPLLKPSQKPSQTSLQRAPEKTPPRPGTFRQDRAAAPTSGARSAPARARRRPARRP
jgi:pseudouridine synthase